MICIFSQVNNYIPIYILSTHQKDEGTDLLELVIVHFQVIPHHERYKGRAHVHPEPIAHIGHQGDVHQGPGAGRENVQDPAEQDWRGQCTIIIEFPS